jgi:uncharacterized membrane protein
VELETLFGLPAHPLMVHLPVVIIPLAGLIAVVFAVRSQWLDRFGWGLVALSGLGALGGILAAGSGEGLEEMGESGGRVEEHAEMGELARTLGIVFFLVVLGVVLARHLARKKGEGATGVWGFVGSKAGAVVAAAALVVSAGAATYTISAAGHEGAKLVWEDEADGGSERESGDSDGEYDEDEGHEDDGD